MDNSIIQVEQLPVIVERLHQIKEEVERRTSEALALDCTDQTYKDVKKERAELNKMFADFENRRKEVKAAILAPYEAFEQVYKDCITTPFRLADIQLAGKINGVEDGIKASKRAEVEAFFNEYRESLGLKPKDAPFEQARLNISISASLKSLKEAAHAHLDKVSEDMEMIRAQESADEIMAEYRRTHNAAQAILIVQQRHRDIEAEQKRNEEADLVSQLRAKYEVTVEEAVQEYANEAPVEVAMPEEETPVQPAEVEEVYEVTFTVRGTLNKIRELKKFMTEGGYDFE